MKRSTLALETANDYHDLPGRPRRLLIGDPYNDFMSKGGQFYDATKGDYHVTLVKDATAACEPDGMHAAHEVNGPRFAHAILTTEKLPPCCRPE